MIGFDLKYHGFYPMSKERNKSGFINAETDVKMFLCEQQLKSMRANFLVLNCSYTSNSIHSTVFMKMYTCIDICNSQSFILMIMISKKIKKKKWQRLLALSANSDSVNILCQTASTTLCSVYFQAVNRQKLFNQKKC